MARDFRDFSNEVFTRANIVRIASDYIKLKKQGNRYLALCPFHKEKTPSFSISPDKNLYYCFGCGAGGNIFNLVMELENVEFKESVKIIAEKSGIPVPNFKSETKFKKSEKDALYSINETAASWFFKNLVQNTRAWEYLTERGVTEDTIKKYRLGYAPDTWEGLKEHLQKNKYDEELLKKSGTLITGKDGRLLDLFRGRIMFPITNYNGKTIGFGGRTLKADDNIKYLNTPNTEIFHKSRNLFGIDKAVKSIRDKKEAILVEGYFDQIMLWQAGFENAVAPLGTAFNEQSAGFLKRYTEKVLVVFDSDSAGKAAALRTLSPLLSEGFDVSFIILPPDTDPDDFINENGPDAFREKIEKPVPMFEYLMSESMKDVSGDSPREKIRAMEKVLEYLNRIADKAERDVYIRQVADRLNLSESVVIEKAGKLKRGIREPAVKTTAPRADLPLDEKKMIRIISEGHISFTDQINELLELEAVSSFTERFLKVLFDEALNDEGNVDVSTLTGMLEEKDDKSIMSRILIEEFEFSDDPHSELMECIRSVKRRYLSGEYRKMKATLSEAVNSEEEAKVTEILEKIQELACQIEKLS